MNRLEEIGEKRMYPPPPPSVAQFNYVTRDDVDYLLKLVEELEVENKRLREEREKVKEAIEALAGMGLGSSNG